MAKPYKNRAVFQRNTRIFFKLSSKAIFMHRSQNMQDLAFEQSIGYSTTTAGLSDKKVKQFHLQCEKVCGKCEKVHI